jgi:putative ABC transport system substrate-binding protein
MDILTVMFQYSFKKTILFGILKYKMKKIFLTFFLSFFTFIASYNSYADDKVYNVYLICWNGFDKSAEGFRDYLVSKDVKFNLIVRNLKENTENIKELKSEIKEKKPDIIITWGTAVTLGIFGASNDNNTNGEFIRDIPVFLWQYLTQKRLELLQIRIKIHLT